jgi:hypothetical protein
MDLHISLSPKSTVYIRVHYWHYTFCGFEQMQTIIVKHRMFSHIMCEIPWTSPIYYSLLSCFSSFFFPLLCWVGVHHVVYKGYYNVSTISYLNSPLPLLLFITSPSIHGRVSTSIIFAFTCMCSHFLHSIPS